MTKTALIADDDASVRWVLSRFLRPLNWEVVEAADGCAAIEKLGRHHIDMVILDHRMPQLSGLEVLNVIRSSATHGDIPVLVVTGAPDAETTAAMVKLGISDFLVKPLRPEIMRDRMSRVDRIVRSRVPTRRVATDRKINTDAVIVVDADAEYRSFINKVLSPRQKVIEAPTGPAALKISLEVQPAVFIVGADIGVMAPSFLAKKLRERVELSHSRLVLLSSKSDVAQADLFDAVFNRTFVADAFLEQFDRLLARSFDDDSDSLSGIRRTVESATEQAVGMMAATSLDMVRLDAAARPGGLMMASVDVQLDTERASFRLSLRCTEEHARFVAGRMRGVSAEQVLASDGLLTLGELATAIAGRVQTSVTSKGDQASFTQPTLVSACEAEPGAPSDVALRYAPQSGEFSLFVVLQALATRRAESTSPDVPSYTP